MRKGINIFGILILFIAAVTSCRNEMDPGRESVSRPLGNNIVFEIGTARTASPQAKGLSAEQEGTKAFLCVEGSDSLYLVSSVMENLDPVFAGGQPMVKGAPVTSENMSEFFVTANLSPTMKYFPLTRVDETDKNEGVYTLDYYWPQRTLDFFAANFFPAGAVNPADTKASSVEQYVSASVDWADYEIVWAPSVTTFGYDDEAPTGTFEYSLPEPNLEVKRDAEAQPDYAFAIAPKVSEVDINENNGGVVHLNFAHCFSAITFRLGSEFMDPRGRQVKEVMISGVPSSGVCTFEPDHNGSMVFDWDTQGAAKKTYIQSIPYVDTLTNVANGQVINDGELTFMLIPHEIDEDAEISIKFAMHQNNDALYQHEITVTKKIKDLFAEGAAQEWQAGRKYIYTIAGEENVQMDMDIDETMPEPKIIGSPTVTSRGTAVVYVRAYIIGWWENESGDVVSPWLGSAEGNWVGLASDNQSSKWKLGSDGFFYYTEQVWPGYPTEEKLFESYELTVEQPPVVGSHLVINVVTQGVLHYKAFEAWPALEELLRAEL